MFEAPNHYERRAKYPEVVTTRVPTELREAVKQIAAQEDVSMHEFIRRAIGERIQRFGNGMNGEDALPSFGVRA
ncbi:ribbon-helix-helix domain-containing protein (plasmid) [Microvirga terrae]|uniref:Ribbon-helix-helix domain-containing protein n=1 Tax=Microvirga terrae TaxID=2740529 RepID=A0ABY5S306_9HYPH|nr:ribbon-helix-helix domain-containing protein [Microvirga terrae]UVF22866.1 ribbon-helix-helix domain-containing protein [Microvirga terrae]